MSDKVSSTPEARRTQLQNAVIGGANWFFWIAGLSLLNSFIALFSGEWNFIFGLGITQVFDALGQSMAADATGGGWGFRAIALLLSAGALSIYVLFGWLARSQKALGFVLGMVFYCLDGGIFLMAGDLLGGGFHAFALFMMARGLKALFELRQLPAEAAATSVAGPDQESVAGIVAAVEEAQHEKVP